ncbi:MAG: DUF3574 domain-containing protein [Magnetococcales bacterium]|nr:DUF3574 domain-containing protein [Magnetococcales bacterium]NGZ26595.1 DUF3574 domain-containing protein [Magnetococcales bacterium]
MMIHRHIRFQPLLGLLALLLLTACQTPSSWQPQDWLVTLSFGRGMANGGEVSEEAWQTYVREVLARKTPGFTAMDCQGGWLNDQKVEVEKCKWVVILASQDHLPAIQEAVADYRQRFQQESVLWLQQPCPREQCGFSGKQP